MCERCEETFKQMLGGKDIDTDVIDLRGGGKDALKKVFEALAEMVGTIPSEEEEQSRLAHEGQKLANTLALAVVAKDTETILNTTTEACDSKKLAGATVLAMGSLLDMIVTQLWGEELTGEERLARFTEVARLAMEKIEQRDAEAKAKAAENATDEAPEETPSNDTASV